MTRLVWVLALSAVLWTSGSGVRAQQATELTALAQLYQLVAQVRTAERTLRGVQMQIEMAKANGKRLKEGDMLSLRMGFNQALVAYQQGKMAFAQAGPMATLMQGYPSPQALGAQFRSWQAYRSHLAGVEKAQHKSLTSAAEFIDQQSSDTLQEDEKLLSKLKEKAESAEGDTQQLQVANQILLELVRQMHQLRLESLHLQRMHVVHMASAQQRRIAPDVAQKTVIKDARVPDPSEIPHYRLGDGGRYVTPSGRTVVRPPGAGDYRGESYTTQGGRTVVVPPEAPTGDSESERSSDGGST